MSTHDEDDKPTVILDLNALKKQKETEEAKLANIGSELHFNVNTDEDLTRVLESFRVILFDFKSDFFQKSKHLLPAGYEYHLCQELSELNGHLKNRAFQIVVFNYDANAKAVNQLSAQIKQKFPHIKVLIVAKAISPEKAKLHAATPSGASGYYQLPLNAEKLAAEFQRLSGLKKAS